MSSGDAQQGRSSILAYLRSNYIDIALYIARLAVIVSCLAYVLSPLFSSASLVVVGAWYRRALLASAASWALRLHQHLKASNSGVAITTLMTEDSFHYLLYSVAFALMSPVSVSLMPVFMLALLHVSRYTEKLLETFKPKSNGATGDGPDTNPAVASPPSSLQRLLEKGLKKVSDNTEFLLRLVALNEVMLMFVCAFTAFSGQGMIMLPFLYYPFLKMRYNSRRNPYSKRVFAELRMSLQQLAYHQNCPGIVKQLLNGIINLVSRMGST